MGVSQAGWEGACVSVCVLLCVFVSEWKGSRAASLYCPLKISSVCLSVLGAPAALSSPQHQPLWRVPNLSICTCRKYWPKTKEKPTWGTCGGFPPAEESSDLPRRNSERRWRPRLFPQGLMGPGLWEAGEQRKKTMNMSAQTTSFEMWEN